MKKINYKNPEIIGHDQIEKDLNELGVIRHTLCNPEDYIDEYIILTINNKFEIIKKDSYKYKNEIKNTYAKNLVQIDDFIYNYSIELLYDLVNEQDISKYLLDLNSIDNLKPIHELEISDSRIEELYKLF